MQYSVFSSERSERVVKTASLIIFTTEDTERNLSFSLNGYPPNAIFKSTFIEVDQKARATARQFQVSNQLGVVDRHKLFDRFQFNNDFSFHHEVNPVSTIQQDISIPNRKFFLPFYKKPLIYKFMRMACFICRFK